MFNTLGPRVTTAQRDGMSKQLKSGFLVFNADTEAYEKWSRSTSSWSGVGDVAAQAAIDANGITIDPTASNNHFKSAAMVGTSMVFQREDNSEHTVLDVKSDGSEFAEFISGSLTPLITPTEASTDWASI